MLMEVEEETKRIIKAYGYNQILRDFELTTAEVIQVLHDCGYIDLEAYTSEE